jgi:hypothetical protein
MAGGGFRFNDIEETGIGRGRGGAVDRPRNPQNISTKMTSRKSARRPT